MRPTSVVTRSRPGRLMKGKRGLVMGVANDHSIAWGIARRCAGQGAELAFTYQGEAFGERVHAAGREARRRRSSMRPTSRTSASARRAVRALAEGMGQARLRRPCHRLFRQGRAEGPLRRHHAAPTSSAPSTISCYSFTEIARRAAAADDRTAAALITLTYAGSTRVMPNYNVMGVAKAALEASVRYLANDLGPQGIRVNAISAGPMRTLAGAAIAERALRLSRSRERNSPLRAQRRRSTRSAARRSTCCPTSAPASPARSTTSMPATTPSACRRRRARTATRSSRLRRRTILAFTAASLASGLGRRAASGESQRFFVNEAMRMKQRRWRAAISLTVRCWSWPA